MDKDLTIKDIIKILPIDAANREELLRDFDSYSEARKLEIRRILWDAFTELFSKLSEIKYQEFLAQAQQGKRQLSPNLMLEAKRAVYQDFMDILSGKKQETEKIEEIRGKLKAYI